MDTRNLRFAVSPWAAPVQDDFEFLMKANSGLGHRNVNTAENEPT